MYKFYNYVKKLLQCEVKKNQNVIRKKQAHPNFAKIHFKKLKENKDSIYNG